MPRIAHWTWPALYMLCILGFSSVPGTDAHDPGGSPLGWLPSAVANFLHLPLYAGLAAVWMLVLMRSNGLPAARAAIAALLLAAGFGGLDELYQGLIPGREPSVGDALVNTLGAALAAAAFLLRAARRSPAR